MTRPGWNVGTMAAFAIFLTTSALPVIGGEYQGEVVQGSYACPPGGYTTSADGSWCDNGCRCTLGSWLKRIFYCPRLVAATPGYVDPRDTVYYSAQGYGVPVSVPLAPVVRHQYNYGWGLPSSRLTRVYDVYDRYQPTTPYTMRGTADASGPQPPMVYWPTDTTQKGFYGRRVPTWQPMTPPF